MFLIMDLRKLCDSLHILNGAWCYQTQGSDLDGEKKEDREGVIGFGFGRRDISHTTQDTLISYKRDIVAYKQNIYTLLKISSIIDPVTGETKSKDDIQKFLKYE